ncbi:MAG: DegQ family serine endoprotease [Psychromonas sp.]
MNIKSLRCFWVFVCFCLSFSANASLPNADAQGKPFPSLAPMLKTVNPAVVNISTFSTRQAELNPLLNDPFFRHFFNLPEEQESQQQKPQKRQQSAGSGVIVDADQGIVMTNYHVIKDSDEIHVSLIDGRSYQAKLMGSDPDLDIAILQIEAKQLTQVEINDSRILEVGDYVVAIGNPFGLGQTVTTGIVSAMGRSGLGLEGYENFIQTDASINPGNSGGALVNLKGELVGINTAIIAPAGGNIGIGFAIPINMAKVSMQQIVEHGEVKRGQIGVGIQDITPELREALNMKNGQRGVLVTSVTKGSPAEKAGLESGDLIIQVDDKVTKSTGQLRSRIAIKSIGDTVKVTVLRNNESKTMQVKVGEPQSFTSADSDKDLHPLLEGVVFENNDDGKGVVVTELLRNSSAAFAGLRPGDLIIGANQQIVDDIKSFKKAVNLKQDMILLQVNRNGGTSFMVIR